MITHSFGLDEAVNESTSSSSTAIEMMSIEVEEINDQYLHEFLRMCVAAELAVGFLMFPVSLSSLQNDGQISRSRPTIGTMTVD